ncbi:MAG TPA: TVP38/TMEM64 family protein [Rhodanobacteraceae bacterium]|nr:TVP38/TMEM64 family protein [Rhodanobacteraceae bacterium]
MGKAITWTIRVVLVVVVVGAVIEFFLSGAQHQFTLQNFQHYRAELNAWQAQHPWEMGLGYFAAFVVVVALSLPAMTLMTLAAGAIFGVVEGSVIVSFGSAIGATLAMLAARFVFKDAVRKKFAHRLQRVDAGIEREGGFYLLSMRLVPVFPFFMVNILMGLTHIRVFTYYWVSQLGMLAGTIVYVNAGAHIASATTLKGLISIPLIVSLALLAVLPWASRWIIKRLLRMRHEWRWHHRLFGARSPLRLIFPDTAAEVDRVRAKRARDASDSDDPPAA